MTQCSKTAIVYNNPNKLIGLPYDYYRWRKCDTNLTSNTPANQYQIQKLIQNTVRVKASLYTANLGPLTAYKKPTKATYNVCWNQMSDRPIPSVQRATIPTGINNSMNSRHHSVTSSRPGCQTPGGIGCDIKHNSYDRYLNRLKGKGPLRRGIVPPDFGLPIPFNPAFPVYGGKTVKTNIVTGCDCPIVGPNQSFQQDEQLYNNPNWQPEPTCFNQFVVGQYVYAIETGNNYYSKAIITDYDSETEIYTIKFVRDNVTQTARADELKIWYPCNCNELFTNAQKDLTGFIGVLADVYGADCVFPDYTQYVANL